MLDNQVEEKYYLTDSQTENLTISWPKRATGVVRLGGLYDKEGRTHQSGSVYDVGGMSPTLGTMQGGHQEPMIVASRGRYEEEACLRKVRTDYGKAIRKEYEAGGIKAKRSAIQKLEPRTDGCTNTLTSVQKDNYVLEDFYKSREPREYHQVAPTLRSGRHGLKVADKVDWLRIRRLTPKECWRLMGFDDSDFEKAQQVNSDSQLYKQAGNSIVVDVLEAIVKQLFKERASND